MMPTQITIELFEKYGAEDGELNHSWRVEAEADVTIVEDSWMDQGEELVENIRIIGLYWERVIYGTRLKKQSLVTFQEDFNGGSLRRDACLGWLQSQLSSGDRSEWIESIGNLAIAQAKSEMARV